MDAKPLRIRFDKIDGYIKVYYRIKYIIIFNYSLHNKIIYLIND